MKRSIVILFILFASCTHPTNIVLDGSKSYDPDGEIVWQRWEQVSGPKAVIQEPDKLKTNAILTENGIYEFKLTVMDNENAVTSKVIQKVK